VNGVLRPHPRGKETEEKRSPGKKRTDCRSVVEQIYPKPKAIKSEGAGFGQIARVEGKK